MHIYVIYCTTFIRCSCSSSTPPLSSQKLRQELLSRQGSVEATQGSVSKLLHSSDAPMDSDLQSALAALTQRYAAAQTCQAEWEAELKALLPRLESYERLGSDLQVFTQSRLKALSPVGQPDRSIDDYRQTVEVRTGLRFIFLCMLDVNRLTLFSILLPFSLSFFRRSKLSWNRKLAS